MPLCTRGEIEHSTQDLVRDYFRAKYRQLSAAADLSICKHPGLTGSHREQIYRLYLQEILPKRYDVGRGMIHGKSHRSKEADIVIWDSSNYPILPLSDHSFFFAESVKLVMECKSEWSRKNFKDVTEKCSSIQEIILRKTLSIEDKVDRLDLQLRSLARRFSDAKILIQTIPKDTIENRINSIQRILEFLIKETQILGCLQAESQRIGTSAIFLKGETKALENPDKLLVDEDKWFISDSFPDLMLLLEPGIIALKEPSNSKENSLSGILKFFKLREDSLLVFTKYLLSLLNERTVHTEGQFYFDDYVHQDIRDMKPYFEKEFEWSGSYGKSHVSWEPNLVIETPS